MLWWRTKQEQSYYFFFVCPYTFFKHFAYVVPRLYNAVKVMDEKIISSIFGLSAHIDDLCIHAAKGQESVSMSNPEWHVSQITG